MKILIVDDEPLVAKTLRRLLRKYDTSVSHSAGETVEGICEGAYDLVFCDLMMPDISGRELFETIEARAPEMAERFIFITGGAFTKDSEAFIAKHPNQILYKPFNREELTSLVTAAETRWQQQ